MTRFLRVAAFVALVALLPGQALAACTQPTAVEGNVLYNDDYNVVQFCDGTNWIAMGGGASDNLGDHTATQALNLNSNDIINGGSAAFGAASPNASALLDLTSTAKGFLPPRMTTIQRNAIASPATGLFIFNTTDGQFQYYTGSAWAGVGYSVPAGTIAAFESGSCPTGWSEYTAARGRFLRGIDTNAEGVDPDGTRTAGNTQADAFQGHKHAFVFNWVASGGNVDVVNTWTGSWAKISEPTGTPVSDGTNGTPRTASETRPKNVAVTYCVYSGAGGGGAGGSTTLAGLTDVDASAAANGKVLTYNSSTSKWEAADAPSSSQWTTATNDIYYDTGSVTVGGNTIADPTAIMDLRSTAKGFLPPRMTTAQRDAIGSPATGLFIFNTTDGQFQYYTGSAWAGVGYSVPAGTIAAFESGSCPTGWSEYTAARGRFLRGIDPTGTNDAVRAAGDVQTDSFQGHKHATSSGFGGSTLAWATSHDNLGHTSGSSFSTSIVSVENPTTDGTNGTPRTANETRPKNVAVTYCVYSGVGGGSGGSATLAGLTDIDVSGAANGKVLTYNSSTSKWEAADAPSGSGGVSPSFLVNKTSQTVTANTTVQVTWNSEIFDSNDNFILAGDPDYCDAGNTIKSCFKPTVAGKYLITANVACTTSGYCNSSIRKGATQIALGVMNHSGTSERSSPVTAVVDMNGTTDYITIWVYNSGTQLTGSPQSNFSGTLVSGGGGSGSDNLGDHTATQDLDLDSNDIINGGTAAFGAASADASAVLDLTSTAKGFLPPRMTTTQRDAIGSPATGLFIFNTTDGQFQYYTGSAWAGVGYSVPAGTIAAFESASCPTGWSEYTAARGRFLRGIDNGAGNDPDGTRAAGNTQADAFKSHSHGIGYSVGAAAGGGANMPNGGNPLTYQTQATGGAETRPKNVAVTYCVYSGAGGGSGSGSATLAGLTDVDASGAANGKVLTYNSSTSKWEASDAPSSSQWTTATNDIYYDTGSVTVGGNTIADPTALMDLRSTAKGFLPPRMTTTQRDAIGSPATGLLIFNTTDGQFQYYTGSAWAGVGYSVPAGTIAAFESSSCPTGWNEYTAARGRFLRGIDNGAGEDPDGTRTAGNAQGDAAPNISGAFASVTTLSNGTSGAFTRTNKPGAMSFGSQGERMDVAFNASNSNAKYGSADEIRPKNVAVTYCVYSGAGGGSGGSTTLAGLTDVDASAAANGKVLTYNSSTSKWEAADAPSSSQWTTATNDIYYDTGSVTVGGNTIADPTAIMDLRSTAKGFLPPRMTTTQRDAIGSPAEGLVVYNTTTKSLDLRTASGWLNFGGSMTGNTMVSGWPDAVRCTVPSLAAAGDMVFQLSENGRTDGVYRTLYRGRFGGTDVWINFNTDGTYQSNSGNFGVSNCANQSIAQLYAAGRAFNFVGGASASAAGSAGQIQFNSGGNMQGDAGLTWDNANKRLGIGTASPADALSVNGNASFVGSLPSDVWGQVIGLGISGSGGTTTQAIIGHQGSHELNLFWNFYRNTGNTYTALASNGFTSANGIRMGDSGILFVGTTSMGSTIPPVNMSLSNAGNLTLHDGTASKPGGGSWAASSDARLKDVDGEYEQGLDALVRLNPVRFHYKKDNTRNEPSDRAFVGLIAQDVQGVFPEAVTERDDGYLDLDTTPINFAVINAIKELKAENDNLREIVKRQGAEIEQLKAVNQ